MTRAVAAAGASTRTGERPSGAYILLTPTNLCDWTYVNMNMLCLELWLLVDSSVRSIAVSFYNSIMTISLHITIILTMACLSISLHLHLQYLQVPIPRSSGSSGNGSSGSGSSGSSGSGSSGNGNSVAYTIVLSQVDRVDERTGRARDVSFSLQVLSAEFPFRFFRAPGPGKIKYEFMDRLGFSPPLDPASPVYEAICRYADRGQA